MEAFSLVSCSSDYFSIGIYTSLENCYTALKNVVSKDLKLYKKSEIKDFYQIIKVNLDSEPLECFEFSTYGKILNIDWKKVFDNR